MLVSQAKGLDKVVSFLQIVGDIVMVLLHKEKKKKCIKNVCMNNYLLKSLRRGMIVEMKKNVKDGSRTFFRGLENIF